MTTKVCEQVEAQLSSLFQCSKTSRGFRVRTPFFYPDGGVIEVFVVEKSDGLDVTDFGEALGWLGLQTAAACRSRKQDRLVQDICLTLGVELYKGQIFGRCKNPARLAEVVVRVGQAVVRIGDLWFTMRTQSIQSITDEVADFLEFKSIDFDRGPKISGRSGKIWKVDFQTRGPSRTTLIEVLSTGSKGAARGIIAHVVTVWHDLSYLRLGGAKFNFVSLFEDTSDIWADEDFKLVEDLSCVSRWSRPDEFSDLLLAA